MNIYMMGTTLMDKPAYAVAKFYRNRAQLEGQTHFTIVMNASDNNTGIQSDGSDNPAHSLYSNSSYNRLQMKVTKMLLVVSSVFLLCHIPSH